MDLFAKDHPLEAVALREKIAKSRLRGFVFEELLPTVRDRIYREMLLKPNSHDSQSEANYLSEHEELNERIADLDDRTWGGQPRDAPRDHAYQQEDPSRSRCYPVPRELVHRGYLRDQKSTSTRSESMSASLQSPCYENASDCQHKRRLGQPCRSIRTLLDHHEPQVNMQGGQFERCQDLEGRFL